MVYHALFAILFNYELELVIAGKVEQNPSECFFNENQSTAWIWSRFGRVRVNNNSKDAGWKSKKTKWNMLNNGNAELEDFVLVSSQQHLCISVTIHDSFRYQDSFLREWCNKVFRENGLITWEWTSGKLPDDVNATWYKRAHAVRAGNVHSH